MIGQTELRVSSATEVAGLLSTRAISSLELMDWVIDRTHRHNPSFNAIVVSDFERARHLAAAADKLRAKGDDRPLLGIPMTVKESFDVSGLRTTWGIPALRNYTAVSDSLAIERLKLAGAIVFGKTNVSTGLSDWQCSNPIYGTTRNPWDKSRTPGGSSGGGAAALAAGLTFLELGSDAVGSIRVPSHFCGICGHRPTPNVVPTHGYCLPGKLSLSDFTVVGPMARTIEDLILALTVLAKQGLNETSTVPIALRAAMRQIQLKGVDLSFPQKTCFRQFNGVIEWGQRIAIVGDNGSGKSSLLRMLLGEVQPSDGSILTAPDLRIGYVAQIQDEQCGLSGGQRVNRAMSQAMAAAPDLLLLDEPTNHLDAGNRRSLSRMLQGYYGTVVMVTHDHELMNQTCNILWHIGHGCVEVFEGRYADYLVEQQLKRNTLEKQLSAVKRAKQGAHDSLMQEQERAAHARQRGIKNIQDRKWATVKSPTKLGRGNTTAGRKQADIREEQGDLAEQLARLRPPEVIVPQFHLKDGARTKSVVLQIGGAVVGYEGRPVLNDIYLTLMHGERMALAGANGSGKSTLARALLGDAHLRLGGDWLTPPTGEIGYVDQHYDNLNSDATVLKTLEGVVPEWSVKELRTHLASFLFRQSESVQTPVRALSGGEKARLSLACIAASPPRLLILDELTNNLDTAMRGHMVDVLKSYPGAMLLISHDEDFLDAVGRVERYHCEPVLVGEPIK